MRDTQQLRLGFLPSPSFAIPEDKVRKTDYRWRYGQIVKQPMMTAAIAQVEALAAGEALAALRRVALRDDHTNAVQARLIAVRRFLLLGRACAAL